ncbi:MAG: SMP-30/gluconolactonase/LRE family protein [Proteobacteria bacterium]|nr:SMP-30/gluconolactonase/LRE family protein [Pseudomonadota bacterium]
MADIDCLLPIANRLGESPIWCERTSRLYWVDSRGPALHAYDWPTRHHRVAALPEVVGSIALCETGGLLAAMQTGIFRIADDGTVGARLAAPEPDQPENRFNDGRCDRRGRFWSGTMNDHRRDPTGTLWRLGADLTCTAMRRDVIVPNSIAWSPDDRRMYFADTYRNHILAFDFDIEAGTMRAERVFASCPGPGRPDGSAVDADGGLWNAEYGGGRVVRYAPDGRIDRVIALPVSQPTCCAFGGPALDLLFITTATQRLSDADRAAQPLAGGLFVARPGVIGLPEAGFRG